MAKSFAEVLHEYEGLMDDERKAMRRRALPEAVAGEERWLVFSDPHVPGHRMDLITQMCERHRGDNCIVAGGIFDFSKFGKFLKTDSHAGSMEDDLRAGDAFLALLTRHFRTVKILMGNHDNRPAKMAAQLSPDLYWLTRRSLFDIYEERHGVELVKRSVPVCEGRTETVCFFDQIGDCIISHLETSGAGAAKGAEKAALWMSKWREELSLKPWRVLLQAHTHKRAYFFEPITRTHCYELGAVCGTHPYQLMNHCYGPIQTGYFHLIQRNGVTDLNASRHWCLDQG